MADKTKRIVVLTKELSPQLGLGAEETKTAERAAQLCKADLVTKMVIEMTSLQGVMGKYYALDAGEPPAVAEAILEHYLPRFAGDATPKTKAGLAVGIADRLDTLTGLFSLGLEPTGTKDPFAQRRAAIGLVQNLMAWDLDFDLREGIARAAATQPVVVGDEAKAKTLEFLIQRQRALLLETKVPSSTGRRPVTGIARAGQSLMWQSRFRTTPRHDVVDAVLAAQGHNPAAAARAVRELTAYVVRPDWPQTLAAFSRCVRITRDLKEIYTVEESALVEDAERALLGALVKAETAKRTPGSVDDFLAAFIPMVTAISRFFEDVIVMAEDEKLKRNRLGLLQRVVALAHGVADFSKLEGF
jgi:glycyl-tRNA synthetase